MNLIFICKSQNIDQIKIGSQIWMKQNLNVSKFRNGELIQEARTQEEWQYANDNQIAAWCYLDNDPKNGAKLGKLYNWYAVMDPRGLAPLGWHVAKADDIVTLIDKELKNDVANKLKATYGWPPTKTGGVERKRCSNCENWSNSYKEKVPCHKCKNNRYIEIMHPVINHPANGKNTSGFSALPGGLRSYGGVFNYGSIFTEQAQNGNWWLYDTESYGKSEAYKLYFFITKEGNASVDTNLKGFGLSVRCVKD